MPKPDYCNVREADLPEGQYDGAAAPISPNGSPGYELMVNLQAYLAPSVVYCPQCNHLFNTGTMEVNQQVSHCLNRGHLVEFENDPDDDPTERDTAIALERSLLDQYNPQNSPLSASSQLVVSPSQFEFTPQPASPAILALTAPATTLAIQAAPALLMLEAPQLDVEQPNSDTWAGRMCSPDHSSYAGSDQEDTGDTLL